MKRLSCIRFFCLFLLCSNLFALQLGDGTDENRLDFVYITDNVRSVSCGSYHSLVIKNDDTLWVTGESDFFAYDKNIPEKCNELVFVMDGVESAFAGTWGKSVVLTKKSKLYFCGDKIESRDKESVFFLLDSDVKSVSLIDNYCLYKKGQGIYGYGYNITGALGVGNESKVTKPKKIFGKAKSIYAANGYSMILTEKNELYLQGQGIMGEKDADKYLKFSLFQNDVKSMSEGFFIKTDNTLWAFGFSGYGARGVDTDEHFIQPTKIMDDVVAVSGTAEHSLILTANGDLYSCGGYYRGNPEPLGTGLKKKSRTLVKVMSDVSKIDTGLYYSMVIKKDGTLWACGANNENNGGL